MENVQKVADMQKELNLLFTTSDRETYNKQAAKLHKLKCLMQGGTNRFRDAMNKFYGANNIGKYTQEHSEGKQRLEERKQFYEKAKTLHEDRQREILKLERKTRAAISERNGLRNDISAILGQGVDPDGERTKTLYWSLLTLFGEHIPRRLHPSDNKELITNELLFLSTDPKNTSQNKKAAETYQILYEKWQKAEEILNREKEEVNRKREEAKQNKLLLASQVASAAEQEKEKNIESITEEKESSSNSSLETVVEEEAPLLEIPVHSTSGGEEEEEEEKEEASPNNESGGSNSME